MVYTNQDKYTYLRHRCCDCDEPGKPIFRGPGKADLCDDCGLWLRRQLRKCLQCGEWFMYIYQNPNMNYNTCWDCVQTFNLPYIHRPHVEIIPPEDACLPVPWSEYVPPELDLPPLPE
jgi:hypothetical protein